jgi:hypothetical protein
MTNPRKVVTLSCLLVGLLTIPACHHPKAWQPAPHAPSIAPPQEDFTLVWDREDANGLPLNPYWGLEKTQHEIPPREQSQHPFPCEADPYSSACTENKNLVMDPPQFPNSIICKVGNLGAKFNGHADWLVGSQHGCVDWENQSADEDYNFRLFPPAPNQSLLTKNNNQFIGLEFDFEETIAGAQSKFWTDLRAEVDKENNDTKSHEHEIAGILNPNHVDINPRAAVIGLVGVDCEHGCKSEIHPVLGFAIETNPDPNDNTWDVFVRNWGDEGFCSRYRHIMDFSGNQLNVLLFDDPDSQAPIVIPEQTRMFVSENAKVAFPLIGYWANRGPVISFTLPSPEETLAFVELEIHFKWNKLTAPSCAAAPPNLLRRAAPAEPEAAEQYWRQLQRQKPAAPTTVPKAMAKPPRKMVEVATPQTVEVKSFTPPSKLAPAPRRVALATDKQRALKNTQDVQAICQAQNNQLPPYRGQDISAQLCDQKEIQKQLKANQ